MLELSIRTEIARTFAQKDLRLLERQTMALEAIAEELRAISEREFAEPPELQLQFALAKRRLFEEAV